MKNLVLLFAILFFIRFDLNAQQWETLLSNLADEFDASTNPGFTSDAVLNVFFTRQLNQVLSESGDIALSKGFAILDNSDGRLFLGGSYSNVDDELENLTHIFTGGIKMNVKDNFARLFDENNGFQNDIGFSIKYTFVGNGIMRMDTNSPTTGTQRLIARQAYYQEKLRNKVTAATAGIRSSIANIRSMTSGDQQALYREKYQELKAERAEEEASLVEEEKLYALAWDWWFSIEAYLPVTKSEYNIAGSIVNVAFDEQEYRPFEINLSIGSILAYPSVKLYGRAYFEAFQNNSVRSNQINKVSYEQYIDQQQIEDTLFVATKKQDDVYVGDFSTFWTQRIGGEFVVFPFQEFMGLSLGIESYFGGNDFSGTNWKVGFPFSLKDKEGKPKINFELQYRKNEGNKLWGISVGLPFGAAIYK